MPDLTDALDTLASGQRCSIAYLSFDEKRGEVGKVIRIPGCTLLQKGSKATGTSGTGHTGRKVKANHYEHATRNVRLKNGQVRKFHIYLLFAINGKKIS